MIGEKLRQLRSEEGNTQMELAKAVDVSVKTVKNWESDILLYLQNHTSC